MASSVFPTYQATRAEGQENRLKAVYTFSNTLQGSRKDLLMPVAPMAVRQLIEAQGHDIVKSGDNVRTKTLFHATFIGLGWIASVVARIIRVVFRTVFAIISLGVAAYQQRCYGPYMEEGKEYNLVREDLLRIGKEWVDLAVTLTVVPVIGSINFFAPQAINTDKLAKFYGDRIDDQRGKDDAFSAARTAYNGAQEAQHNARVAARAAAAGE